MTIEKAQKDFMELIQKNGFTEAAKTTDTNNTVYHREWTHDGDKLEIRMMLCGTAVLAAARRNGRDDPKFIRDYTSPKRAMKAIREIVRFAGFEW